MITERVGTAAADQRGVVPYIGYLHAIVIFLEDPEINQRATADVIVLDIEDSKFVGEVQLQLFGPFHQAHSLMQD